MKITPYALRRPKRMRADLNRLYAEFVEKYRQGKTITEIARSSGESRQRVYYALRRAKCLIEDDGFSNREDRIIDGALETLALRLRRTRREIIAHIVRRVAKAKRIPELTR
jgi:hypothetical protein